jgi:hypothetical protein
MRRLVKNPEYGPNSAAFRTALLHPGRHRQIDLQVVADPRHPGRSELNPAFHRWATDPTGPHSLLVPIDVATDLEPALLGLTPGSACAPSSTT